MTSKRPNFEQVIITPPSNPDLAAMPLITDTQYLEPLASNSLNRKFSGIVHTGIFRGFECDLLGGMNVRIHSDEHLFGVALVERDDYTLTVRQQHAMTLVIPTSDVDRSYYVVLEAFYQFGVKTKQVDITSHIDAAAIKVIGIDEKQEHQLIIAKIVVPAGATVLTEEMLDLSEREYNQYASQAQMDKHHANYQNPHHVNKHQVGLGDVNNWGATSSIDDGNPELYATAKAVKLVNDKVNAVNNKAATHWEYIAKGNETIIDLPYEVPEVDSVVIQGIFQTKNKAWQFLSETNQIEVAELLDAGDEVIITLGTPSADASVIIAELQQYIEVLEHIINNGDLPTTPEPSYSPMEVHNGIFTEDSEEYSIPVEFLEREIKLVFIQGLQQAYSSAYTIDKVKNVVRFASMIPTETEITIAG